MPDNTPHIDDVKQLHGMGYAQELSRRMSGFSNFAISFSIICILAGGITTFGVALSAAGGASVGIGWLVGGAFAIIVSLAMGQIASSYPTAGGLYHWSSILGGKAWGWTTAWFNLLGLIFVVSSVDAGLYDPLFKTLIVQGIFGADPASIVHNVTLAPGFTVDLTLVAFVAVAVITQALLNHYGIRVTTLLTDFSGYLIFAVAILLTLALLIFSPVALDFSRLFTFTNFTGDPGGGVWPATSSLLYAFIVGMLLVTYTITGYDASAHTSEETTQAAVNVPRGMWQSVFWSVVFGYFMVCAFVLVMPKLSDGAAQGLGAVYYSMNSSNMGPILRDLLYVGIMVANYLCALAGLTSCSRMMYAFARDGGLPASKRLSYVSPRYRTPTIAIWASAALAILSVLYGGAFVVLAAGTAVFLYISYLMPVAAGILAEGKTWKEKGPFDLRTLSKPIAVLAILGALVLVWVGFQPPNQAVGYLIIGLIIFMALYWFARERTRFAGPPTGDQIAARQGAIADIEAKLEKGSAD